jgi:hypothetical protein
MMLPANALPGFAAEIPLGDMAGIEGVNDQEKQIPFVCRKILNTYKFWALEFALVNVLSKARLYHFFLWPWVGKSPVQPNSQEFASP